MNDVKYWKDKLTSLSEVKDEGESFDRIFGKKNPLTSATSSSSPNVSKISGIDPLIIPPPPVSDEQMKTLKIPAVQRKLATASPNVSGSSAASPALPSLPPSNVPQGSGNPVLPSSATSSAPATTAVSPTVSTATTSGASAKPRIGRLPGETVAQAIARTQASAPTLVAPAEPKPNVWRDARNPQYAGRGQTQPAAVPVLQPAAAPQPAAGSIQPQSFTRMGDVQKQLDVSAGRGLNTSAQIDPLSMPREPETGYGRPAPATQGSNIKNMLSRLSRLGRSAGDEYSNLYVSPMRSGVASRGTTPVQDRAYIKDLQNKLAKNPLDDNLRGELARMQRFYPDEIKEASTTSDIGQFNPGADRLSSSRMPSKLGKFNPGADRLTGARMPTNVGKFSPGEDRTTNPRMPSDIGQVRPGADRSAIVPSSEPTASSTPRANLRSAMPGRGGDEYTNVYGNTGPTSFQDQQYIRDLEAKVASDPNYEPWAAELWRMKNLRPNSVKETSMSSAEKKSTGPKFPGYWRGTDPASAARSKMVGSVEESIQHRATVLMNRYKNFKGGK